MITSSFYGTQSDEMRNRIKKLIKDNNYNAIDIGASANFWSYPECKTIADAVKLGRDDILQFSIDFDNIKTYSDLYEHVKNNGKYDFSICMHTLEDIFNPLNVIELLVNISKKGFIAIPSKYDEFSYLFDNKYLGNAHHKQILDVIDNKIVIFPKFSFIEVLPNTREIIKNSKGRELYIFWEEDIPVRIFGNGVPFPCDSSLIHHYFNELSIS